MILIDDDVGHRRKKAIMMVTFEHVPPTLPPPSLSAARRRYRVSAFLWNEMSPRQEYPDVCRPCKFNETIMN